MPLAGQPQWYVSGQACALCDDERHLAHIVKAGDRWFAFDATHPNGQGIGCLFLGSFVRKLTAMEAAESETLQSEVRATQAADSERVCELTIEMLRDTSQEEAAGRRRQYAHH